MKDRKKIRAVSLLLGLIVLLCGCSRLAEEEGYRDIRQGLVVTGTAYEGADMAVDAWYNGEDLSVEVTLADPTRLPFQELTHLAIGSYQILDKDSKIIQEGQIPAQEIEKDTVLFHIPAEGDGQYKLVITEFQGEKKADAPLSLPGSWECVWTLSF